MKRRESRRPRLEALESRELLSVTVFESEPNDRKAQADVATLDPADRAANLVGSLSSRRDEDFFRLTAPAAGNLSVNVQGAGSFRAKISVEDASGVKLLETEPNNGRNGGTFAVRAGQVLFFRLRAPGKSADAYNVSLALAGGPAATTTTVSAQTAEPSNDVREVEANDDKARATRFDLGADRMAQLSGTSTSDRDRDFFTFTPTTSGSLSIKVGGSASLEVEDAAGVNVLEIEPKNGATTGTLQVRAGVRYTIRLRAPRNAPAPYTVQISPA